jgi:hypothetical protein
MREPDEKPTMASTTTTTAVMISGVLLRGASGFASLPESPCLPESPSLPESLPAGAADSSFDALAV